MFQVTLSVERPWAIVNMLPRWAVLIALVIACGGVSQAEADYFTVAVKDSQTGRGVPLVKLTASGHVYYTDSNGVAAVSDSSLAQSKSHVLGQ